MADDDAGVGSGGGNDGGLFMFSSRLQMRLLIPSGSSCSLELWLDKPLAVTVDVEGRLDASDCVRFANDVIVVRAV